MQASGPARPLKSHAARDLRGTLTVPGDKSISHRALMLGTLAQGETTVSGLLESGDILSTADAMRALGAHIVRKASPSGPVWHVHGPGIGALVEPDDVIDYGNAGTGVRLCMGLVATTDITCVFTGDASLRSRPMGRALDPLILMGANAITTSGNRLPLAMHGAPEPINITYRVPVPSAQVKSAVLMAGLSTPGVTTVIEPIATRDHTERMIRAFGGDLTTTQLEDGATQLDLVGETPLTGCHVNVPADPSSAAFPLVAALITPGSEVTVTNVMLNPARIGLITTLQEMGADITISNQSNSGGEDIGDITARYSKLQGITVPADRAPSMIDEYPVLAVAAAFASGVTRMEGLEELRVKESDRLSAVANGLKANGVPHRAGEDWLEVDGSSGKPVTGGGTVATHLDHRIAMAFLVMGCFSDAPVTVDDARPIATSFPEFEALMSDLGAQLEVLEQFDVADGDADAAAGSVTILSD